MAPQWSEVHKKDVQNNKLNLHIFPVTGKKLLPHMAKHDFKKVLASLQAAEKLETAKKVRSIMAQIVDYFIDETGKDITNWPARLHKDFSVSKKDRKHRAALVHPCEIGQLMLAIEGYRATRL